MSDVTGLLDRVRLAVRLCDLRGGERVLEVGGGPRTAAPALLADGAAAVHLVDRSATALDRALARVGRDDRVTTERAALASIAAPGEGFDVALAVNVNPFWTSAGTGECAALRRSLVPGGRFVLVYGGAPDGDDRGVVPTVAQHLRDGGFDVEVTPDEPGPVGFVCRSPGAPD